MLLKEHLLAEPTSKPTLYASLSPEDIVGAIEQSSIVILSKVVPVALSTKIAFIFGLASSIPVLAPMPFITKLENWAPV